MKKTTWFTRHQWISLGAILVLFTTITLGNMNRWSIWFDEGFSAYLVRFNFAEIAHFTAVDVHPPLYYWALKLWTMVCGVSPLAMRSMSLLCALIALVGVFVLVRRILGSPKYALAATLGFSLTPLLVRYTDEARMYTMVLAIVVWASYVLIRATTSRGWKWWLIYAALIAAGMLTHYLIALAWVSHWVWRFIQLRRHTIDQFFSRYWLGAHVLAIALFAWWVPPLIKQFTTVQQGFWVPLVNVRTPIDLLSNSLIYRQGSETNNWWTVAGLLAIGYIVGAAIYAIRQVRQRESQGMGMLAMLTVVPPLLLVLISMPPLKSTFVDRYVLYAMCMLMALAAIGTLQIAKTRPRLAIAGAVVMIISAGLGISNVYYFGNYNKNSTVSIRTHEVILQIDREAEAGQPIVTATPWLYFEAAPYSTSTHPVYYTKASVTQNYGSLAMLKERSIGRIDSLSEFTTRHRFVWYLDNPHHDVAMKPPIASWKPVKQVDGYDSINRETMYRAVLYDTAT